MKTKCLFIAVAVIGLAASRSAAETGVTNIINGVTNNVAGDYYVGNTGPFNGLIVTNAGQLSVSGNGFMGYTAAASNNTVLVTGSGSVWNNYDNLYVGNSGSGNSLTITNNAVVDNFYGYIGYNSSASNNTVLVSGPGSLWNTYNVFLGYDGSGNSFTLSNGGAVPSPLGAHIWIGYDSSASSNAMLVTGSNTVLNIGNHSIFVGYSGTANQLTIQNGAAVSTITGFIGYNAGSSNNAATVTGPGSVWNTGGYDCYVGDGTNAANNQLTITNGGHVINANGWIGYTNGANNNAVTVAGSGSVWSNTNNLYVGNFGAGNNLTIVSSGLVVNATGSIGNNGGANNNSVLVSGSGTVWSNSGPLYVGDYGAGNSLTISNGAHVVNGEGDIGYNWSGAINNSVLVTGSGSVWTNTGNLFVSYSGSANSLTITNGGQVFSAQGKLGGNGANNLTVTGTGSVWNMTGGFQTGATSNQVTISNGGQVSDTSVQQQGDYATFLVTGSGSVWSNSSTLRFGYEAPRVGNNQLTVSNGGKLYDTTGWLGAIGYGHNSALVTGSNSVWNNSGDLLVSYLHDPADQLTISNGGAVLVGGNAYTGSSGSGAGCSITLSGGSLIVTNAGTTGTLNVNYGTLTMNGGTISADSFVANNGASSVVNFNYGTLNMKTTTVANGSAFTVGDGTDAAVLNLQGGAHNFANGLVIAANSQVCGAATINANVTNNGALGSGASVGTLTIASNYTQNAGGALSIKLGGIGSNDVLAVSGTAQLGGTLTVTNLNGFQPALSNAFTILTAQTVSGTFAAANLPTLGGGVQWQLTYAPASVVLRVVSAPLSALKFTASPVISGTSLTISATNTGAGSVYLLTSTNVAAPINTWTPIWTNVLGGNGSFTTNLVNAVNPALNQQFYLLGNTNN